AVTTWSTGPSASPARDLTPCDIATCFRGRFPGPQPQARVWRALTSLPRARAEHEMGQEDGREAEAGSASGAAVREQVEVVGPGAHLLGCRHVPDADLRAVVLVCTAPPFDQPVDAGRTARLGRRLARAGVAVQRFGWLDPVAAPEAAAAVDVEALVDDARRALELLRDRCPVERVGLLGVRLGALVAARLARSLPGAPVALWQPVTLTRTALAQAARPPAAAAGAPVALWQPVTLTRTVLEQAARRRAAAAGAPAVDVLGTRLGAELAEGVVVGGLVDELGAEPRPLFVAWTAGDGPGTGGDDVAR